jgi:hypothetical protein
VPRTDLQALVLGTFLEEVLGLTRVTDELDRIAGLLTDQALAPGDEPPDVDAAALDRLMQQLAVSLGLPWPWATRELRAAFHLRRVLLQLSRQGSTGTDMEEGPLPRRLLSATIPGWPPKGTYERRRAVAGGGPWAVVDHVLAPRFSVKRGDALSDVRRRWQDVSDRVEQYLVSSLFSTYLDEGPPNRTAKDDLAAYERYARWTAWHLVGGVSYREIAREEFKHAPGSSGLASDARERWREISRGLAKARSVLDSI